MVVLDELALQAGRLGESAGVEALVEETALVAEYLLDREFQPTAMVIYSGTWLMLSIMINVLWWYATSRDLVHHNMDAHFVRQLGRHFLLGPPLYAVALLVSIVSFEDTPGVRFSVPPLTAIRQPTAAMIATACARLIAMAGGEDGNGSFELPYDLIVRASTAGPPA